MNPEYMRRAIELAKRGEGRVSPNPLVGCVVVKDEKVIAQGWHDHYGGFHAERNALTGVPRDVTEGADLYVTLEPCCHHGKTPPCTDIIIEKGIKRVFVGSDDPNPLVAGGGFAALRAAGIEVQTHVLKDECDSINEVFFHYISTKTPFVVMKYAMTLDGKINLGDRFTSDVFDGSPLWTVGEDTEGKKPAGSGGVRITGDEAQAHVHLLRKRYSSIMVGVGTVLADDPMLNYRQEVLIGFGAGLVSEALSSEDKDSSQAGVGAGSDPGEILPEAGVSDRVESEADFDYNPTRIIVDSHLRTPVGSRIVQTAKDIPTIIAYVDTEMRGQISSGVGNVSASDRMYALAEAGVRLMPVESDGRGHVSLSDLLKKLGADGIDSILVEGGSSLHGSFMDNRLINRVYAYISPRLFGGQMSLSPVGGIGVADADEAMRLADVEMLHLGDDICITGKTIW